MIVKQHHKIPEEYSGWRKDIRSGLGFGFGKSVSPVMASRSAALYSVYLTSFEPSTQYARTYSKRTYVN